MGSVAGSALASSPSKVVLVTISRKFVMSPRRWSRRVLLKTSLLFALIVCMMLSLGYVLISSMITDDYSHPKRQRSKLVAQWDRLQRPIGGNEWPKSSWDLQEINSKHTSGAEWDSSIVLDWVISKPPCPSDLTILIMITSAPSNVAKRTAIRNTWCKNSSAKKQAGNVIYPHSYTYMCLFLLGRDEDPQTDYSIEREAVAHNDILIGAFADRYRNLTYKVVMGLTWSSKYCSAKFVLKTDDDCFVSVRTLLRLLPLQPNQQRLYAGWIFQDRERRAVIRDPVNKWFVSEEEYLPEYYPPYASGTGYLLSQDVWLGIVRQAGYHRPFPNEDAYIGVVLAGQVVKPLHSTRFAMMSSHWSTCNLRYLLTLHRVESERQQVLQDMADRAAIDCEDHSFITSWR